MDAQIDDQSFDKSNPVLLATDLKADWQPLVSVAGKLAEVFGRSVVPLHVVEIDTHSLLIDHYRRQLTQRLFAPLLSHSENQAWDMQHPVVLTGPIIERIVEYGEMHNAATIVLGAGKIGKHGSLIPGVFTAGVIGRARQPVFAVHPTVPLRFERILCPIDNSNTAKRGLQNAIALARSFSARLTVMSVIPHVSWLTAAADARTLTHAHEEYALQWEREFDELLQNFDFTGVDWTKTVKYGAPAEEILFEAERSEVDLIALGAIGRSGIAKVMMGSTALRVFQNLPCSLLVVHDHDLPLVNSSDHDDTQAGVQSPS